MGAGLLVQPIRGIHSCLACAQATTATVRPTQLTAITAGTALVTVTAGANHGLILPAVTAACPVPSRAGDLFCAAATKYARSEIDGPGLKADLSSLYAAMEAQAATVGATAARIIVFGYPDFYRGVSTCGSDVTEQNDVDNTVNLLDTAISRAVDVRVGHPWPPAAARTASAGRWLRVRDHVRLLSGDGPLVHRHRVGVETRAIGEPAHAAALMPALITP